MVGRTGETMLLILEGGGKGGGRREGKRHTGGRREGERHWREEGSALQECTLVLQEGEGPEGSRGARLVWVDKERIVVSGFNKLSEQCRSPCACPPVLLTIEGLETCNMHTQLSMHTHTHTILHLHVHNTHANTYTTLMHTHTHTHTTTPSSLSPFNKFPPPPNRSSLRTLSVYNTQDLKQPLSVVGTNISPATLMPFYDPDTHLLFLTGKVHPHILRTGRDGEEE